MKKTAIPILVVLIAIFCITASCKRAGKEAAFDATAKTENVSGKASEHGQSNEAELENEYSKYKADLDSLQVFIGKNLVYPAIAKDAGASGTIYVTFMVGLDGTLSDAKVIKSADNVSEKIRTAFETEALRVINAAPSWNVGGRPTGITVPILFKIAE